MTVPEFIAISARLLGRAPDYWFASYDTLVVRSTTGLRAIDGLALRAYRTDRDVSEALGLSEVRR